MCYESLNPDQPIRQGDIFFPLPRPKISLDELQTLSEDAGIGAPKWVDVKDKDKILAIVELEKTWGIVATQDCDATRSDSISLFQIVPFGEAYGSFPGRPSAWVSVLTERICKNASWFYLPKDDSIGINSEMAINFHEVFQIERIDLEKNINLRMGRLEYFAYEHYREAIAQYFRRYPYNEWYSFNKSQLEYYATNVRKCKIEDIMPKYPMNEK
ncbi:MAG: hypothetical protein ACYDHX_16430 [Methanothrix sp.]